MKVKSVRITLHCGFGRVVAEPPVQVHEGQANVSDLHHFVRDGVACINYLDTHTGDRIGDSYPLETVKRIQTVL